MSVLVVGRGGQVARALQRAGARQAIDIDFLGRPELDLEHPDTLATLIAARKSRMIINAAGFTAVDAAQAQSERAYAINAIGAEAVALVAAEAGIPFVHLSTDYVFGGDKGAPYNEEDAPAPRNVYGASKFEGEQRIRAVNPAALIVRTAWIYGEIGKNFVTAMLAGARTRDEIVVVADQIGCPTYADDLGDALLTIAKAGGAQPGIYHCAGEGQASWALFASELFDLSRACGGPFARVVSVNSKTYGAPATRPSDSRLNCSKIGATYGVFMRPWREGLRDCVNTLAHHNWRLE